MIVGDLLELDGLHIGLAWGTSDLLGRQVTGVTSTDLQDPARYLQPGKLVLSGLVWWQPEESSAALRFATSLRSAGVAALLAGEGTHGRVPDSLVAACRTHAIPLLSVPPGTSFRTVTDRVHLRLWGGLHGGTEEVSPLPEAARRELLALLHEDGPLETVLTTALTHAVTTLGLPDCSVHTGSGRLLATSSPPDAAEATPRTATLGTATGTRGAAHRLDPAPRRGSGGPAERLAIGPTGETPFDGWLLRPHTDPGPAAATVLGALAELLAPLAARARTGAAAQRQSAARLLRLLAEDGPGLAEALASCGLPTDVPLIPVTARIDGPNGAPADPASAVAALAEALHQLGLPFAVGPDAAGGATALVAAPRVTAPLATAHPGPAAGHGKPAASRAVTFSESSRVSGKSTASGNALPSRTGTPADKAAAPAVLTARLRLLWPALQGRLPQRRVLRAGVGPAVAPNGRELRAALVEAGYALAAGGTGGGKAGTAVGSSGELSSLAALLRGLPGEVTRTFHARLLAPLTAHDRENAVSLLGTLDTFLDHDGSWARTAEALHIHVNTVHYRIRRIEELTGRSLSLLEDRVDLRAALLCAP
ncbi:PucR family transcriptional regulator [Kitasatospora sp. MMS16-BH015]|uniref:PucR family transcriptional regulator n=1 Tax=Kitasatospora sp. MMS16-BH015 TaxID=2018025 RepID=UPI000CA093EE|nr:PucR family transcriptional regulator ligand-binding domain-containing protein [Kitasatospora sp. MMS16-BH015]AUG76392.1 PucR family transcriptional regulator [Kitasatospora sp. MMS16-BH015]